MAAALSSFFSASPCRGELRRGLILRVSMGTIPRVHGQRKGHSTVAPGTTSQDKTQGKRSTKRLPYFLGGAIIVIVIGWLLYSNIQSSVAPYMTVTELLAAGPSERLVRVTGSIVGETIFWDDTELLLRFEIADEGSALLVQYRGVRPDLLEDGTDAVVEGRYQGA